MKNKIAKLKNTGEGIKNRLDEAEGLIRELDDKVEKTPTKNKKRKND